jgi:hypothetical protein
MMKRLEFENGNLKQKLDVLWHNKEEDAENARKLARYEETNKN